MVKVLKAEEARVSGTYLVGYLEDVNFMDLVTGLGEPTFDDPSGDDKVQVEWVVKFNGKIFTIYDWKTYDREFTEHSLTKLMSEVRKFLLWKFRNLSNLLKVKLSTHTIISI